MAGRSGVVEALELLRREFDLAFALCGCTDVASVTRDLVDPGATWVVRRGEP